MLPENTIMVRKKNETYLEVLAVDSIMMTLRDFFSFFVPGHQFMEKFRKKFWDGKIYLLNRNNGELYCGLLQHLKEFARQHEYEIVYTDGDLDIEEEFSIQEAEDFATKLNLHVKRIEDGKEVYIPITPHDYQIAAFRHAVQTKRCLLLSPTASGKSAILYLLIRYYQEQIESNRKILLIVPTVNLVSQMYTDFGEYSYDNTWDVRNEVHMVYQGKEKGSEKQIIISTWQSLYQLPLSYFEQFDVILGDECHLAKAQSISSMLQKSYKAQYRIGTTGTLDGSKCNKLVLEGLFGKVYKVTTTVQLQEKGTLAQMMINCLMLHYPEDVCKKMKGAKYQDEVSFIVEHEGRNKFIRNLSLSLKGNTLVLFNLVERHGKILYEDILNHAKDGRKVFFISGKVDVVDRELFRKIVETESDAIIVASLGTFSTGVNLRNLHNIVLASPSKSRIRVLQSLGRGLRLGETKDTLYLFDISDDLQYKTYKNHGLKHFLERMKIYNSEKFLYKIYKVRLKS
jgi:superfamily II DNA or RNA helicase